MRPRKPFDNTRQRNIAYKAPVYLIPLNGRTLTRMPLDVIRLLPNGGFPPISAVDFIPLVESSSLDAPIQAPYGGD